MIGTSLIKESKWVNMLNAVLTVSRVYRAAVFIAHYEQVTCLKSIIEASEQYSKSLQS